MGVPAHDERDWDFAARNSLPAPVVIAPPGWDGDPLHEAHVGPGTMVDSGPWDGLPAEEAKERIAEWMEQEGIGQRKVHYRMRDWLISRQRYWGAPIPIVYCSRCGTVPVPEESLPVVLPDIEAWRPREDGRSPLANVPAYLHTACPACGRSAQRETDTLDGFACSSWYYLRFVSPSYSEGPFDPEALARWGAPDLYVGGAEHAVMHLLYARFWTKVMADAGLVSFREPFPVLRSQGVMHARDPDTGEIRRMSKSAGNVVTPDEVAAREGADALRVYLLFMAPFENHTIWEADGIVGARRLLERTWRLVQAVLDEATEADAKDEALRRALHQTIQRVTEDIETFRFNTAVAALMGFLNTLSARVASGEVSRQVVEATRTYVLLLAPFAPHIAEELWVRMGGRYSVHQQAWPEWEQEAIRDASVTMAVQVDGRVRDRLQVPAGIGEEEARERALGAEAVRRYLHGRRVTRVIYVPGRLVNVVTEPEGQA